jgi:hypothetical protein
MGVTGNQGKQGSKSLGSDPKVDGKQVKDLLTSYDKALRGIRKRIDSAGTAPLGKDVLDEATQIFHEELLGPLAQGWTAEPDSAAEVVRYALSQLGFHFHATELQDQITKSGFGDLVHNRFNVALASFGDQSITRNDALDAFAAAHDEEAIERAEAAENPKVLQGCAKCYVGVAEICRNIMSVVAFKALIWFCICIVVVLTAMTTYEEYREDDRVHTVERVVIALFTFELVLRIVGEGLDPLRFVYVKVEEHQREFHVAGQLSLHYWTDEMSYIINGIQGWNVFDTVVVITCLPIWGGDSEGMAILRMCRMLKVIQLMLTVPQIRVVLNGLASGLKALVYILAIFSILFYVYGLIGLIMFADGDEFHFANQYRAMITMARMATGPWQDVMSLNMYGCHDPRGKLHTAQLQSYYCNPARYNDTALPISDSRGAAVAAYFVSFYIMCAFVTLSLLFGVITTAMSRSLASTNQQKFTELRLKRQDAAQKSLQRQKAVSAHLKSEHDAKKYKLEWGTPQGSVKVRLEKVQEPGAKTADGTRTSGLWGASSGTEDLTKPVQRRLVVVSAQGLALTDGTASNPLPGDPFVVVHWKDCQIYRSQHVMKTVNPVWDDGQSAIINIP